MTIRFAFLVDSPSKRAHGNAASRLALGLAETGQADTTLLCYSADPAPPWLPPEVRIHRLGTDRVTRSLPSLVRYLRANQPDVLITRQVHANFVGLAASYIARVPPRWKGKLVLVQDHPIELSHASNRRDNKWLAKVTYHLADGLVSPSPGVRENISRWCKLDPSFTAIVPNPIPKFAGKLSLPPHPWLRDGQQPVFVHTSNMTSWKRLDLLIDAFAQLRQRKQARLLICGEGPGRSHAAGRIRQLNLDADAQIVGWVGDPLQYAAHAWAFVLTSDEEGFAQVLTEAMSVGCPVISTDAQGGGPRFVTTDGKYGLLVPRGDPATIADAMERMLNPDVRALYSDLGQQRTKTLTPLACAGALLDFVSDRLAIRTAAADRPARADTS
jgi:glycosyltransferase involved in cell wall biosynthesis